MTKRTSYRRWTGRSGWGPISKLRPCWAPFWMQNRPTAITGRLRRRTIPAVASHQFCIFIGTLNHSDFGVAAAPECRSGFCRPAYDFGRSTGSAHRDDTTRCIYCGGGDNHRVPRRHIDSLRKSSLGKHCGRLDQKSHHRYHTSKTDNDVVFGHRSPPILVLFRALPCLIRHDLGQALPMAMPSKVRDQATPARHCMPR